MSTIRLAPALRLAVAMVLVASAAQAGDQDKPNNSPLKEITSAPDWSTRRLEGDELERKMTGTLLRLREQHFAGKPYLLIFYNGRSQDLEVQRRLSRQLLRVITVGQSHNPEVFAFDIRSKCGEVAYVKFIAEDANDYRVRLGKGDALVRGFNGKTFECAQLMGPQYGLEQLVGYVQLACGVKLTVVPAASPNNPVASSSAVAMKPKDPPPATVETPVNTVSTK